jgi:hypothetical protein
MWQYEDRTHCSPLLLWSTLVRSCRSAAQDILTGRRNNHFLRAGNSDGRVMSQTVSRRPLAMEARDRPCEICDGQWHYDSYFFYFSTPPWLSILIYHLRMNNRPVKFRVFWDILPCSQPDFDRRFRGVPWWWRQHSFWRTGSYQLWKHSQLTLFDVLVVNKSGNILNWLLLTYR